MNSLMPLVVLLAGVLPFVWATPAAGQMVVMPVPSCEANIVESAASVLGEIMTIPGRSIPGSLLAKARGIAIIPGMLKGGFIIGVRYGRGVVVTRDEAGNWKPPLFVHITGGSFGWQAGVQGTDLVLVFCTKTSLDGLMRGNFTIGATASAAAGPVGREAEAATDATLKAEIYSYSRSRGLFAGVALDGALLSIDQTATNFYYQSASGGLTQPGQPVALPASAGRLMEQLAKYTTTTVMAPVGPTAAATTVTVDTETIRRQLAGSWQQLAAIIDAPWRTFLALPAEVYSSDRPPSAEALRLALDHFTKVAADPRYQSLTQHPEFQTTWALLRQYSTVVAPPPTPTLSLPPPPK